MAHPIISHCKPKSISKSIINKSSLNVPDNICGGFIGVEYVIKIINRNGVSPTYECILCNDHGDASKIQEHLLGQSHRKAVLKKHFPTTFRKFLQYSQQKELSDFILDKITKAIESYHGKSLRMICESEKFYLNRKRICDDIHLQFHPSELNGPSFVHAICIVDIERFLKNMKTKVCKSEPDIIVLDTTSNDSISDDVESGMYCQSNVHRIEINELKKNRSVRNTKNYNNFAFEADVMSQQSKNSLDRTLCSPSLDISNSTKRLGNCDVWQKYYVLLEKSINSLDFLYEGYFINIETHPNHDSERSKFYFNRETELKHLGIDTRYYDYDKEWKQFFKKRIHETYDIAVKELKDKLRHQLGLPMTIDSQNSSNNRSDDIKNKKIEIDLQETIAMFRKLDAFEDELKILGPSIFRLIKNSLNQEEIEQYSSIGMLLTPRCSDFLKCAKEKLLRRILDSPEGKNSRSPIRSNWQRMRESQHEYGPMSSLNIEQNQRLYREAKENYNQKDITSNDSYQNDNLKQMWPSNLQQSPQMNFCNTQANFSQNCNQQEINSFQNVDSIRSHNDSKKCHNPSDIKDKQFAINRGRIVKKTNRGGNIIIDKVNNRCRLTSDSSKKRVQACGRGRGRGRALGPTVLKQEK